MQKVKMKEGFYKIRGKDVDMQGMVFPMVSEFKIGASGGYVTVDGTEIAGFPDRNIKIKCESPSSYELVDSSVATTAREETDEETIERMRERFEMLEDMTKACKKGDVRAMIVSGPPGVGKSHGVEKVLGKHDLIADIAGTPSRYQVVKGAMSAIGLYCKLFNYADKDNVLVFDDCDSVFSDELSLNILKAALDSKKNRTIHWNTDSFKLRNEGVPDSFTFRGSAIFITNIKFDNVKSAKMRDHLTALESRCHYIDLTIDTDREKMLRIKQITNDGMLDSYKLSEEVVQEIIDFIDVNKTKLRELSLRTVLKVADLAKAFPTKWEAMAENTVMSRAS
ncbi:MAG: ATP-binding protein [Methylophagaceae bacterium]|jgi:predicted AAA+ superfamily ATPase|tara:strand:+ start:1307 stop:2317 length:1011 start_codon:yes stop_codon:yes gene_type:complete